MQNLGYYRNHKIIKQLAIENDRDRSVIDVYLGYEVLDPGDYYEPPYGEAVVTSLVVYNKDIHSEKIDWSKEYKKQEEQLKDIWRESTKALEERIKELTKERNDIELGMKNIKGLWDCTKCFHPDYAWCLLTEYSLARVVRRDELKANVGYSQPKLRAFVIRPRDDKYEFRTYASVYCDGSGSSSEIQFFKTEVEANQALKEHIENRILAKDPVDIKVLRDLGLSSAIIDKHITEKQEKDRVSKQERISKLRKEADEIESQLGSK